MISDSMAELHLAGPPTTEHIDFEALDGHRFADGEGFPDSYREFVRHAGWGRTFGMWLVYPPVRSGYADGLHGRGARLTARFRASYREGETEEFDWMVEPDGHWSLTTTLEVFAWSENGDALLWNTASRDTNGEFAVWESRGCDSLHHLGADLRQALPLLRARSVQIFGHRPFAVEPLPVTHL
ncbi:hypothetical protein ACH4TY_00910 [Streptomyces anulatus]